MIEMLSLYLLGTGILFFGGTMEFTVEQISYMKRALALAEKARGFTEPNPLVGAVIVKDGKIVGEGYHKKAGTPHAEINALSDALHQAMGATMFVTLEPCSHYGKTPPCANALVRAGIKEVFIALEDPNPLVNGKGIEILKKAGIIVHTGLLREDAILQNRVFLTNQMKKRAYIALKSAQSIDGKIGPKDGAPITITCEESRKYGHILRRDYGAVLVGRQTVLKDDPKLNIRYDIPHPEDKPVRIVLDPHLRLSINNNMMNSSGGPVLIYTADEVSPTLLHKIEANGGNIVVLPDGNGNIDLDKLAEDLLQRGICAVLVEGGANTLTRFINQNLWDEYHCFIAPKFIGKDGLDVFDAVDIGMLTLNSTSVCEKCGDDIHIIFRNKNGVKPCLQELSKKQETSETSGGIRLVRRSL